MKVTNRRRQWGCARPGARGICVRPAKTVPPKSLGAIVRSYRLFNEDGANEEHRFFASLTPELAIKFAGNARDHRDKRYAHQRRIKKKTLEKFGQQLWAQREAIEACLSFEALLGLIRANTDNLYGAGKLLAYDTALRLGAHFGHRPTNVYLHAGAKTGAINLGYPRNRDFLELDELPPEFQNLLPEQVEDILCIYKEDLKAFWAVRA